ncbi:SubName: Full=Uncharacterized protein {ECO:0000313/EMBL:CCA69751.1} [Serendipita indica DSM 11827]|uniref:Uncharacterized protein n=1 Tax=Serendipita indica (strain DSM 11827) TaxID=1109443 RepID=G4TEK2_SERID|nr:SubName: Full=Uncharacterized protein {ECO:0000313/EMBL:CCA69751.1} [Serendipita indica DSM 11827]CCA69751.1 hypothetical protein PIIN_03692 [Serendipita indica DSM 11827]
MIAPLAKISVVATLLSVGVSAVPTVDTLLSRRAIAGLSLSQGCENTVKNLLSSPAATCMNLPGTVAIFSTVANSSWIPPINKWLSDFCGAPDCTGDQITSTLNTVMDGCANDIAQLGVTIPREQIISNSVTYFPQAKSALCLRDSSNSNKLCAITTLENLQTALGGAPLTPAVIEEKYPLLLANNYALAKQLACTPCTSAAFALVRPALPQSILTTVDGFVGDQCGVDFTSQPTGSIAVVTGTAAQLAASATASSSPSAGFASFSLNLPVALLVGIASIASFLL